MLLKLYYLNKLQIQIPKNLKLTKIVLNKQLKNDILSHKALRSKLLTKLSSWFSSRNEFFAIFEVQV